MTRPLRFLIVASLIALIALSSLFAFHIEFTAVSGLPADVWLFVSDTGGVIGVPFIVIAFSAVLGSLCKKWSKKIIYTAVFFALLIAMVSAVAKFNEHILKEQFRLERPYTAYLKARLHFPVGEFYSLPSKEERRLYFEHFISRIDTKIQLPVSSRVLRHWQHEAGYSFPSGHSENAFLMVTLIGYCLLKLFGGIRAKLAVAILLGWAVLVAVSRVAVGAHSALDVSAGALLGTLIAFVLIASKLVDLLLSKLQMAQKEADAIIK